MNRHTATLPFLDTHEQIHLCHHQGRHQLRVSTVVLTFSDSLSSPCLSVSATDMPPVFAMKLPVLWITHARASLTPAWVSPTPAWVSLTPAWASPPQTSLLGLLWTFLCSGSPLPKQLSPLPEHLSPLPEHLRHRQASCVCYEPSCALAWGFVSFHQPLRPNRKYLEMQTVLSYYTYYFLLAVKTKEARNCSIYAEQIGHK